MSADQLWAPWRLNYILTTKEKDKGGCFICRYASEQNDAENLVVLRDSQAIVVMNRYPYNNGHLLVAPLVHKANLADLTDEEMLQMQQLIQRLSRALQAVLNPEGFNVGLNLGRVAGAGLPGHLHWHIVPRWGGDTSFMTVCADVNVIPQSLAVLYELLVKELARG